MPMLLHRVTLMVGSLCFALACSDAIAQVDAAVFKFPHDRGSLELRDGPCTNSKILQLYEGDMPEPFLAGTLRLNGRVLAGCWYQADGRIFFTDEEGDALVPRPPLGAFSPAGVLLQTTGAVSPSVPALNDDVDR